MNDDAITKRCSLCGEIKPLTEFYSRAHSELRYKRTPYTRVRSCCKACDRARTKANRAADKLARRPTPYSPVYTPEQQRKMDRERRARYGAEHPGYGAESMRAHRRKNPEAARARKALNVAVRAGKVPRASTLLCDNCGSPAVWYRQPDCDRPLEVIALCRACYRVQE